MGIEDRDYMRERARNRIAGKRPPKMSEKTKGWIISTLFFSMVILFNVAGRVWGWMPVLGGLLAFLTASLLVSRCVMGRSWHSVLWGDRS